MYPIDKSLSKIPVLLNDFFRHYHKKKQLQVFLCGTKPKDPRFDLRKQVKRLLDNRMGCVSNLGEDLTISKELPKLNRNLLTIEVKEAEKSDLIIMFLGSAGTLSELTAFAMNKNTNEKLVIFNDTQYKDQESFINLGPLKLIKPGNIIYYDIQSDSLFTDLISQLDIIVASTLYNKLHIDKAINITLDVKEFAAYILIYASFPIRFEGLLDFYPWNNSILRKALRPLHENGLIKIDESKYLPSKRIEDSGLGSALISDISRIRSRVMNIRLVRTEDIADYRLIM